MIKPKKSTAILFYLVLTAFTAFSQQNLLDQKITIRFEQLEVSEALEKIEARANCIIAYRPSALPKDLLVTESYQNISIRTILQELWEGEELGFLAIGNKITIQVNPKKKSGKTNGNLSGQIKDEKQNPLPGVNIKLAGTTIGDMTDKDGKFSIRDLKAGNYTLIISSVGFQQTERTVEVKNRKNTNFSTSLILSIEELEEVVVLGKTEEQEKMEEPIKVEAINTQALQSKSISLPQVINQTAGVKVRQAGGVGGATLININGLQGNAIRFFRDGIPLEYLGRAFDLSIIPVDQLDNVDIYKGVLPADLGADALGGALNFTSRENFENNLDLAYSIGSFNTHQVNMNGYYSVPNTRLFVSLASYYVYSDNNYRVSVPIADPVTANLVDTEVERFHDGIESYFVEGKIGFKEFALGDWLEFSYARFNWEKERQNGIQLDPNSALGEVMDFETSDIFATRYKLSKGKLNIDAFGSYSNRNTLFIDNPEFRYNWLGEQLPLINNPGGETNTSTKYYRELNFDTWTGRLLLNYQLGKNHEFVFNHNVISENRIGSDTLEVIVGIDINPLTLPTSYIRNISSLGITSSFFKERVKNVLTIKRFRVNTASKSLAQGLSFDANLERLRKTQYGFGNSTKFSLTENRFIRISYEFATRIPESIEFLGDGFFVFGNSSLKPETTHNINWGYYSNLGNNNKHWIDINLFYRFVRGNIFLTLVGLSEGVYRNMDDARVIGSELSLKGAITPTLKYNFSVTYQDIRRANPVDNNLGGARQPNIPYFFSNAGLRFDFPKDLLKGNWDTYLNYGFVEKFLLSPVPKELEPALFGPVDKINSASIIDTQHTLDMGMTYKQVNLPLWISLEVNNVLDIPVFDGFRVQLPGRNFRLKLKYRINGKSNENANK
ncbi:MAG: TonB-dependent receptor [Bacteroidota bacterium]